MKYQNHLTGTRKAFLKSVRQHDGSRRNKPLIAVNTLAELHGIPAQTGAGWLAAAKGN